MSENLFLPLTLLAFSWLAYILKTKQQFKLDLQISLGILVALCILTRTIAIVLIPAVIIALGLASWQSNSKNHKLSAVIKMSVVVLITSLIPVFLFGVIENLFVQNTAQAAATKDYSSFMPSYLKTFWGLITLKNSLFTTIKLIGNSLIYLLLSSFIFPVIFLINDLLVQLKTKRFSPLWIFMVIYGGLTLGVSLLHSYGGFQSNPIRYSTYFRYLDSVAVILLVYGLLSWWKLFQSKKPLPIKTTTIALILSTFFCLMLPARDFYLTINALGWGWLDVLLTTSVSLKLILILISSLIIYSVTQRPRLALFVLVPILILNILTIPVQLRMHNWLGADLPSKLQQPVIQLAQQGNISRYYFNPELLTLGERGSIYYIKYLLLFYTDQVVPMTALPPEELADTLTKTQTAVAYLDSTQSQALVSTQPAEILPMSNSLIFAIFKTTHEK
jgi:hypothetical protein